MQRGFNQILIVIVVVIIGLVGFGAYKIYYPEYRQRQIENSDRTNPGSNLLPMYGGIDKTVQQKQNDQEFIDTVVKQYGSKEAAAKAHIDFGWDYFSKGDNDTAMKRFNQAWLLDPNNGAVYWGFGEIILYRDQKFDESMTMFEKAISVSPNQEKVNRIYCDLGLVLMSKGGTSTSQQEKNELFKKAESAYKKGVDLDPQDDYCYPNLAVLRYYEEKYTESWEYVHKARSIGSKRLEVDFKDFLKKLSSKMADPGN